MRLFAFLFGLVILDAAAALAQSSGEQLFVPPPKGWVIVYHLQKSGTELTEVTPQGQSAKEWTEMLAVRIVAAEPAKTPEDMLTGILADIKEECEAVGAGPVNPASENGYDTAMRAVACPKSKDWGKGELSLFKVLKGQDRTYVVSRAWRGDAFEKDHLPVPPEVTKQWLAFMKQVVLCDQRNPQQHRCPSPAPAAKTPER